MPCGPYACSPAPTSDQLVAELDGDRALDDVEALVLGVVDVQRDLQTGWCGHLDERVAPAGVGGGGLDLGEHAEEPALLAASAAVSEMLTARIA
jgi:hypothetical protein